MENEILKYLSKYIPITKELEEEISRIEFIKCFDKGTILLEEGKKSIECFFIIIDMNNINWCNFILCVIDCFL